MAKHKGINFLQLHNNAIKTLSTHNHKIPYSARWLYIHLNLLEHRFTNNGKDHFFRSIKDLQKDIKMGRKQIIGGIKELEGIGLIQTWQIHWINNVTGKKSEKHITAFRILNV